jgi:two-component system NtrC family sensor kinase
VRELTTLYGIGKAVTSTTNQAQLFNKLMEGSQYVTEADLGWVLLEEEGTEQLVLRAQKNLPPALAAKLHQPWDDGVSSLVMLSGEALSIHGEGLSQFKLARIGKAALLAPIKVREQTIGVICVARQEARPFGEREQAMLEAVADYASISLVNARLFQVLEARASKLQQALEQAGGGAGAVVADLRQALIGLDEVLARAADEGDPARVRVALTTARRKVADLSKRLADIVGEPEPGVEK